MKKILFVYGTRPEAIKLAPLVLEFKKYQDIFDVKVCLTGQHRQMLDQVNSFFGIKADYDLNLMTPNQTLSSLTAKCIEAVSEILIKDPPSYVIVQGDTTTVMATSLAAYFCQIPVVHIEAGLRSGNKYSPFPEEINRIIAGHISHIHFAPTVKAKENLLAEGIKDRIFVVGNTVIDSLLLGLSIIENNDSKYSSFFSNIDFSKRIILVTGHRRESFGKSFEEICNAIKDIIQCRSDVEIIYPVHLNPNVQEPVKRILAGIPRIHLIDPLDYPYLIWIMNKSYFVLTDSGGIQEEAPALAKPVLVMRDVTERKEGIEAGTARLVGSDRKRIRDEVLRLLDDTESYKRMSNAVNPYGDGTTSKKIVEIMKEQA